MIKVLEVLKCKSPLENFHMVSSLGIISMVLTIVFCVLGIWLFHSELHAQKLTISINHDEVNDIREAPEPAPIVYCY